MAAITRSGIRDTDYTVSENGCWIWALFTDREGYGFVRADKKPWRAHRFSWTVFRGPIPNGMEIDHLCFQPSCINPDHLRVVAPIVNMRNHRAARKTHCANGHEFTPENTRMGKRKSGSTYRMCIACRQEGDRRRRRTRAPGASA